MKYRVIDELATARKDRGLKIADVAELAGYPVNTLQKMECGNRHPSIFALTAWANALGFDISITPRGTK